ncbi:MAG: ribose ABC transporter permease [Spirochaetes bacterium]|nr:MAG: ribose ABC transporter permease [Spirochaetota bacterium]RKX89733.1 MAG: ribose ABC transporter permease [Spirochaetota bacterium]RKX98834.1 MAG: ribose ABC transporter permease [Spirochaetota bacterium]
MNPFLQSAEAGAFLAVIILGIVLTTASPQFLTVSNLTFVARGFSFIAIASLGVGLVIITGGIDLSVGSIMGLSGVIAAFLSSHGFGTVLSLSGALLVGVIMGFLNGILVAKAKLAPFIVTLGMLSIGRGLVYVVTGGWPMQGLTKPILFLGQGFFLGLPLPVWIMIVLLIIMQIILRYTAFGWYVYSIGGNDEATRLSGVFVDRIKIGVYVISGFFASIGGIVLTARLGVGETTAGNGYELNVIAALVLGGVSLSGGMGSAVSALFGAALMGILRNGLVLLGVSSFWQQISIGTVIILAALFDQIRLKYSK